MSLPRFRRRFRIHSFTLRTFVLAITFVVVFAGGLIENERRQQAAIARLLAAGGSYQFDSDAWSNANRANAIRRWLSAALGSDYFDRVIRIRLVSPELRNYPLWPSFPASTLNLPNTMRSGIAPPSSIRLTDDTLARAGPFHYLRELEVYIDDHELTDNALQGLRHLRRLESLSLSISAFEWRLSNFGDAALANLHHFTRLRTLRLHCPSITNAGAIHLRGLTSLEHLDLAGTSVTEECLAHLVDLTNLQSIELPPIELTDSGAASLGKLPHLGLPADVTLKVTDRGVEFLSVIQGIDRLILTRCPDVTDTGVRHLRNIRTLRVLSLGGTRITDAAMDDVARIPQLRELHLGGTAVTDQGIAKLRGLPLEVLSISYCQVTDASVATLCQMPLRKLMAHGTKITDSGFAEIQAAHAAVAIHR